ncbi:hypothetical protein WJX81_006374 [Elliptochloris bilobata]|uniref:BSD domain-containing protein n=1 Tax=Elliptochloris bilobata TaxID=381761 RepID=A0AAW1SK82_9CHLO
MAMLIAKRTKLTVRKERVDGVLSLSHTSLSWRPNNPNAAQAVDVVIANMTAALQKAKGKPLLRMPLVAGALVLEFESEADRNQVVDVLTPLMKQAAGAARPGAAELGEELGPLAAAKQQLLEEDKDLQQLYKQLVQGGVLSEADFWRGRQAQLQQRLQGGKGPSQRVGLSSVMLAHMQGSQDGRSNTVTMRLTPELVQQIFAERPYVRRAHAALVPQSLDEKAFWSQFMKHEMAKRTAQARLREARAAGKAASHALEDAEDPFAKFRDPEEAKRDARRKVGRVDPTVNLAADRYDGFSAQGDGGEAAHRPKDTDDGMLHDINRHAAVVLQGLPSARALHGGAAEASGATPHEDLRERAESALDDLRRPAEAQFLALHISDPRRYFDSSSVTAGVRRSGGSAPAGRGQARAGTPLSQALRAMEAAPLRNSPVDPAAARRVLADVSVHRAVGALGEWEVGAGWAARPPAEALVPQMQGLLRGTALTCYELLRHFWASFPLTTPAREQRVQRIKAALCEQYDRTTAMQESARGLERVHITQVLKPLRQALDAALSRLEQPAAAALVL